MCEVIKGELMMLLLLVFVCGFQTCCREWASYHNYQDNVCSGLWNNFFRKTNEKHFLIKLQAMPFSSLFFSTFLCLLRSRLRHVSNIIFLFFLLWNRFISKVEHLREEKRMMKHFPFPNQFIILSCTLGISKGKKFSLKQIFVIDKSWLLYVVDRWLYQYISHHHFNRYVS